ncbi:MAG: hypothetical protein K2H43_04595, partial [Clostridia bacterium]|nr:hypothetical protein [Clostridia bacterium]
DTRANAYGFYLADGTLQSSYNDLYKAIDACVEDGDEGDYVAKLSGDDKDVKLFTFKNVYSGASSDQFYYYENGTSLDRYTPWESSYHTDLGTKSKNDLVVYKTAQGLDTYRQGYEVVRPGATGGTVATWNIYPFYDSSVMVDLPAYCGITKAEYTINLKEAKLYPTYEGYQTTYAKVGFVIPDANNVAHIGLAADVNTGNWYYFYGNADTGLSYDTWNGVDGIDYVTDECWMTSTWNEEGGYYTPDSNIVITAEIIAITEDDETPYYINRLTVKFDDDTTLVKDYEHSAMTACATMRFMAGLDIQNEDGMPMYDNGAQFQGLKVTSGKGTIYEDVANDPSLYGDKTVPNDPGVYDLLDNSKNPEDSDVCLHTVLYNRATITYDYSTPGTDIYNFSFRFEQNQPAYSSNIRAVKDGIAGLPAVDELTVEDDEALQAVVDAYNYLVNPYQTDYITDAEKETLDALQKKMATLKLSGGASAVIEAVNSLKEIGFDAEENYTTAADLKLQSTTIKAAYDAYVALSEEEKAGLEVLGIDAKLLALHKALIAIEA